MEMAFTILYAQTKGVPMPKTLHPKKWTPVLPLMGYGIAGYAMDISKKIIISILAVLKNFAKLIDKIKTLYYRRV